MYFVYVLEDTSDKSWYIGYTTDIERRIIEHQTGKGGRTTKLKDGWRLVYYESYVNQRDATGREKFLKGGSGRKYLKKQLMHYLEQKL